MPGLHPAGVCATIWAAALVVWTGIGSLLACDLGAVPLACYSASCGALAEGLFSVGGLLVGGGVRTLIQFLSRIILGGFLETAPRWLPARLDLAVIGCRIRPCRYNLPVGLGDVRMRPMLVANRLGMARCGCRNDRFCHAAKPAGSGR